MPARLLYTIAWVESSFNVSARGINPDGTEDLGLMQINSRHLRRLAQHGIDRTALLTDACLNAHVGAMILSENFRVHGYTWRAVGAYNAGSEHKRAAYVARIQQRLARLP